MNFHSGFSFHPVSSANRSSRVRESCRRTACGFAIAALLTLLLPAAVAAANIGSGYSALWYNPARSGEGLQLEILDSNYALVEWYTYDEHGAQRWITGVGLIVHSALGDSIDFAQLFITQGGKFGPDFDPNAVTRKAVGDATLSFSGCDAGTFHYDAFGQSQTLPMQRLTQTMGAGCQPINGVPGEPVMAYAGQSGSWYNASRSGEGFDLEWMSNNQAIVTWYTYDAQGNPVWLLGVGAEQPDGSIRFEHMDRPHGAQFGTAFDPASVQHEDWGALTLQIDCGSGTVHYASSDSAFGSGDIPLTRLTSLKKPGCPTVKPKLSDLYDISWNEIPISAASSTQPNQIAAYSIADEGTVAGTRNGDLVLWHPDTSAWEDISSLVIENPEISADGTAVVATSMQSPDSIQTLHTAIWHRETGWTNLSDDAFGSPRQTAVSHNFQYVIGTGSQSDIPRVPWLTAIDQTSQALPTPKSMLFGVFPNAVSDDGNTVVGSYVAGGDVFDPPLAIRWANGEQPTIMKNPAGDELSSANACDADCGIVYGSGRYLKSDSSFDYEAWYQKTDGTFGYLGTLPDAVSWYAPTSSTSDGSLVAGGYTTYPNADNPDDHNQTGRAFIWTQATGIVSVRRLVNQLGIGDDDWGSVGVVRVSSDGLKILLPGTHRQQQGQPEQNRAVVLELTPKPSSD